MKKIIVFFTIFLLTIGSAYSISAEELLSKAEGSVNEKLEVVKYIQVNQLTDQEKPLEILIKESRNPEVLYKSVITAGNLEYKGLSLDILKLYNESSRSDVRFASVLALLKLKDLKTLSGIKKAYQSEADTHVKQILGIVMKALENES